MPRGLSFAIPNDSALSVTLGERKICRAFAVVCAILVRCERPVIRAFCENVHRRGEKCSHFGAKPVNPVRAVEASDDGRAERPRGVHGAASQRDGPEFADEQREADTDGREWRGAMLLNGKHENSEGQL